jgi:hypothetical protein
MLTTRHHRHSTVTRPRALWPAMLLFVLAAGPAIARAQWLNYPSHSVVWLLESLPFCSL